MENKSFAFLEILKSLNFFRKELETSCKKYDVNLVQLFIIIKASCEKQNVSKLSDDINVSKSAISQALIKLFLKKYIKKVPSNESKKIFYIEPTNKGKEISKELLLKMSEFENYVIKELGENEVSELTRLLNAYRSLLQEYKEGENVKTN